MFNGDFEAAGAEKVVAAMLFFSFCGDVWRIKDLFTRLGGDHGEGSGVNG